MIYDQYRYVVFKDPNWDWKTFDFDKDVVRGDLPENLIMNATDPNMQAVLLARRQDPPVSRLERFADAGREHDQVLRAASSSTWAAPPRPPSSVRLFMAPGMGHCGGGEGPNTFDTVEALEDGWSSGRAPATPRGVAQHRRQVDRTRPLCPYPQVAIHGRGQHRRRRQLRLQGRRLAVHRG